MADPSPSIESGTSITPDIAALAASLGNDPVLIYDRIRENFRFETYFGFLKGAQATLETGGGNDYDLAALTGALLQAAGYNIRDARGTAIIPAQAMVEWLGLEDTAAANVILNTAGISAVPVVSGPTILHYRVDRFWVEVEASPRPGAPPVWHPLDPAFKRHDLSPGIPGMLAAVPFDETAYLSVPRTELTWEFYRSQVQTYLDANLPGSTVADVPLGMAVVPESLGSLPRSLPYQLLSLAGTFPSIPAGLRHTATIRLRYLGGTELSHPLVLPDTSLQRMTLSYDVNPADQSIVDSFGGLANTPPGAVDVIPNLKLDGTVVATGGLIPYLDAASLEIDFFKPGSVFDGTSTHSVRAGEWAGIGIDAYQVSETHLQRQVQTIVDAIALMDAGGAPDPDEMIGAFLYLAIMEYYKLVRDGDAAVMDLAHYRQVVQVSEGAAFGNQEVLSLGGVPFTTMPGALVVDVPRLNRSSFALDDDNVLKPDLTRLTGFNGSAQEHALWEGYLNVPGVSTIKSLQLANQAGIPVFVIDDTDGTGANDCSVLCPQLNLSPFTEAGIAADVAAGRRVTVPRDETPINDWVGVGYITEDTSTGAAGYIISGGLASATDAASGGAVPPSVASGGSVTIILEDGTILVVPAGLLGDAPGTASTGDPVNIANGNLFREEKDFEIPALMEPLGFTRVYNSQSTYDGPLGPGWTHSYGDFLAPQPGGEVIWVDDRGTAWTFKPDAAPGTFISPPGLRWTLVDSGGGFTLSRYDGRVQTFDAAGRLLTRADRFGNTFTFAYDGMNRLMTVSDPASRTLSIAYTGTSRIQTVSDFSGRTWSYAYDPNDRLAQVTSPSDAQTPARVVQYAYDASNRLAEITEANGGVRTVHYYSNGRVAQVIDPLGHAMSLVYNPFKSETSVTDERGMTEVHQYNASGNRVGLVHADGSRETWTWADNRLTSHTNPLGQTDTFVYDGAGNLMTQTDASGVQTSWEHASPFHDITQITRPGGRVTTLVYDTQGALSEYHDAAGSARTHVNNAQGLPETVTEPGTAVVTLQYNGAGQLTQRTTQLPSTETIAYTPRGQVMSRTDGRSNTTAYDYDLLDRIVGVTDAEMNEASMAYDTAGRLVQDTDPRGHVTAYEYDLLDRLTRKLFHDGTGIRMAYDPAGNLVSEIDEMGRVTRHEYDSRGRRVVTRFPDGGVLRMAYDAAGRLVAQTDPLGNTTRYEYDAGGRRTKGIDALGHETISTYDANGNLATLTDRNGGVTTFEYDGMNRLSQRRGEGGLVETFDYDANGNLIESARYDVSGLGTIPSDPRTLPPSRKQIKSSTYDDLGRLETATDEEGHVTTYQYDAANNLVTVIDPRMNATTYEYDKINRNTKVIRPDTGEVAIAYDGSGNRISLTTPRGGGYSWTYDARNRVTEQRDPLGAVTRFEYDAAGSVVRETGAGGAWVRRQYDPRSRPARISRSDGTYAVYVYDAAGNMIQAETESTRLAFGYDALNRRTGETLSFTGSSFSKTVSYTYDDESRLASITDPAGRVVAHGRDLAGRLTSITDTGGPSVGFTYTPYGLRETLTYGNGTAGAHSYDRTGRPAEIDWTDPVAHLVYARDPAGNPMTITESVGGLPETLGIAYDGLNRPVSSAASVNPSGRGESFAYDLSGNLTDPGDGSTTAFDLADQPTGSGATSFTHDRRGNRILSEGPGGSRVETPHDPENRLTAARLLTGATLDYEAKYTYDALGRLVEIRSGAATVRILHAFDNRLAEFDETDTLIATYTAGDNLDDLFARSAMGAIHYLHRDGMGSVRAATDAGGSVVGTASYGLFGRIQAATGAGAAPLGFTGRPHDPQTGFVDMRARFYDAAGGRFLERDPLGLHPQVPNPYVYAANQPLTFVDPLGLSPSSGWLDGFQFLLDLGGLIPVIGEPIDLLNAGIYSARGDWVNAALSAASAIPIGGYAASAAKGVNRAADALDVARDLGRAGEQAADIVKNTERIGSASETAAYRIPDVLNHADEVIGEVKNVKNLSYTNQLRDFAAYAAERGYTFELYVRPTTQLSGPLQEAVANGTIVLKYLP